MNEVKEFLKANGFESNDLNIMFVNDKCSIAIGNLYYTITDNDLNIMYTKSVSIYELIGMLTYCGFMDKNYKQLQLY